MSLDGVQFDENQDLSAAPAKPSNHSGSKLLRAPANFLVSHNYVASVKSAELAIAGAAIAVMLVSVLVAAIANGEPERTVPPHLKAHDNV